MLHAYRWQYIVSGVKDERFQKILGGMITEAQSTPHRRGARADHPLTAGVELGLEA